MLIKEYEDISLAKDRNETSQSERPAASDIWHRQPLDRPDAEFPVVFQLSYTLDPMIYRVVLDSKGIASAGIGNEFPKVSSHSRIHLGGLRGNAYRRTKGHLAAKCVGKSAFLSLSQPRCSLPPRHSVFSLSTVSFRRGQATSCPKAPRRIWNSILFTEGLRLRVNNFLAGVAEDRWRSSINHGEGVRRDGYPRLIFHLRTCLLCAFVYCVLLRDFASFMGCRVKKSAWKLFLTQVVNRRYIMLNYINGIFRSLGVRKVCLINIQCDSFEYLRIKIFKSNPP